MYKYICIGVVVVFIGSHSFAKPKSQIIVSAGNATYCLDYNGTFKWRFPHPSFECPYAGPAIGDIDRDGVPEIIIVANRLYCIDYYGNLKWFYPILAESSVPVIANIDTTGDAEVLAVTKNATLLLQQRWYCKMELSNIRGLFLIWLWTSSCCSKYRCNWDNGGFCGYAFKCILYK